MNHDIEELDGLVNEIDDRVRILAHSKTSILEDIASALFEKYADDLIEMDEVFAFSFSVSHARESATSKKIKLSIEPAFDSDLDVEEAMEKEKKLRKKIYENLDGLDSLYTDIHVNIELFTEKDDEKGDGLSD